MEKKNKAAKAINTALGLIVIVAVILFSPLFGYARGFSTPEQRQAAAQPSADTMPLSYSAPSTPAIPRPTMAPTPTPVVLPTAPPTPDPTPTPTPRPVAVQQPVQQQPVQQVQPQNWTPEGYWEGEEYDEDAGAADAGSEGTEEPPPSYEGLGEQVENGVISTGGADIVFENDMGGGEQISYTEPTIDYSAPVQQESSEGEAFTIA